MDKRLFPINLQRFNKWGLPIREQSYIWKGRPPIISHYKVFCGILYIQVYLGWICQNVLVTGIACL
jgi:hypothetical protein